MLDQKRLAAAIAGIFKVERLPVVVEAKRILKFLQQELHAVEAARQCGKPHPRFLCGIDVVPWPMILSGEVVKEGCLVCHAVAAHCHRHLPDLRVVHLN